MLNATHGSAAQPGDKTMPQMEAPSDILMKNDILDRACPDTLVAGGTGRVLEL